MSREAGITIFRQLPPNEAAAQEDERQLRGAAPQLNYSHGKAAKGRPLPIKSGSAIRCCACPEVCSEPKLSDAARGTNGRFCYSDSQARLRGPSLPSTR